MGSEDADTASQQRLGKDLGRAIRVFRTSLDMSRRVLAARAEISYSYLSEIEKGSKQPSTRVLREIAEALGTSAQELFQAAEAWSDPLQSESPGEFEDDALSHRMSHRLAGPDGRPPKSRRGARTLQRAWFNQLSQAAHESVPLASRNRALPTYGESRRDEGPVSRKLLSELRHLLTRMSREDQAQILALARRLGRSEDPEPE